MHADAKGVTLLQAVGRLVCFSARKRKHVTSCGLHISLPILSALKDSRGFRNAISWTDCTVRMSITQSNRERVPGERQGCNRNSAGGEPEHWWRPGSSGRGLPYQVGAPLLHFLFDTDADFMRCSPLRQSALEGA